MTEATADWPPPGIDGSTPSSARVYDAILGGRDNFKADREAADFFLRHVPQVKECARENRRALHRGVRYLVREAGIDQILDIGCGLPTEPNTHQIAQEVDRDARVVYVDNDPMVLSHGRALLADDDTTRIVTADLRDPEGILEHPDVKAFVDFDRPVAAVVVATIVQISDHEHPDDLLAALMAPLPPGSHLFLTVWPDTGEPMQRELSRACMETLGTGWIRPVERLRGHFAGLEMVPPGLEYIARWFPEEPDRAVPAVEDLEPYQLTQMAGIAKKV
ncbi:SAM-dependent methyltransferase [Glycomyces arizonensis]|uniref:SAM-dependent methyltransferase n=1 Tax=Glycomyces arizonensis TaxID=256035 RepID=UPI00040CECCA|nr:SAM-dependent methyltransferase [Glycomyces arizonensis]